MGNGPMAARRRIGVKEHNIWRSLSTPPLALDKPTNAMLNLKVDGEGKDFEVNMME